MPFCSNCGTAVEGQFCAKCGTPIAANASAASGQGFAPAAGAAAAPAQPAPVATGMTDNVASLLCYLLSVVGGILFLVLEPYNRNKAIRFHAFQSIFFFAAWVAISIVVGVVGEIFGMVGLFGLWHFVARLVFLGLFVIWIMLMVKAYQNQKWVLPIIGPLAEKQA